MDFLTSWASYAENPSANGYDGGNFNDPIDGGGSGGGGGISDGFGLTSDAFGNTIGWDNSNSWSEDLLTTYVITDAHGGEHISYTEAGAEEIQKQCDFHYEHMISSDGIDYGPMFEEDALNLYTDHYTYYIGTGLSVQDVSQTSIEHPQSDGDNSYRDLTDNFLYPGVTINADENRSQGYFNPITKTINLPGWATKNAADQRDYIRHEYGHYLQLQKYGYINFLLIVTPISIGSAKDPDHLLSWSEIEANQLANDFFQSMFPTNYGSFFDIDTYRTH